MRHIQRLAVVAAIALTAAGPVKAETVETAGFFCVSVEEAQNLRKFVVKGLSMEQALIATNVDTEKCLTFMSRWNNEKLKKFGPFNPEMGDPYLIVHLKEMKEVQLLGNWRPIPDWLKPFKYTFLEVDSKYLPGTAVEPSKCDDDCI